MTEHRRRVVVTGIGMVTPIGLTVNENWQNILACKSGIGPLTRFNISDFPVRIAGELKGFDPADYIERKEIKKMDPFIQFAMAATKEAMEDCGLTADDSNADRIGVIIGSGQGGITMVEQNTLKAYGGNHKRISPFFVPSAIINLASGQVAIKYGLRGLSYGVVSACSTGVHAIADGYYAIQRGDADAMVVGGSEATITPTAVAGFHNAKALSLRNGDPEKASRPFDLNRDGFVIAEGGACIILEELEGAKKRNATIHAEVVGYGATCDAHHITAPADGGEGIVRATRLALACNGIAPEEVGYVCAHGTSTPFNDKHETLAMKTVFGDHALKLPISSIKSMTGHLLGGAGALESVATIQAIVDGILPPTINYEVPDPDCDLDYVPNEARKADVDVAINNSMGFGGQNASLIFRKFNA